MVLPPGGFFVLGAWLLLFNWLDSRKAMPCRRQAGGGPRPCLIPEFQIFIGTLLANNFVLAMFLGLCPFLGVSGPLNTALPMGAATTFVMLVASLCAFGLNWLVTTFDLEFLRLISYIVIIASAVQLVEMVPEEDTARPCSAPWASTCR
jgi:Na+-translocating ferredoxin:NAD+ oxidoreductase RnfE subunit